jgi:hypothetical protein
MAECATREARKSRETVREMAEKIAALELERNNEAEACRVLLDERDKLEARVVELEGALRRALKEAGCGARCGSIVALRGPGGALEGVQLDAENCDCWKAEARRVFDA